MSFKCSVFGHRYGDPEVEREREEQGSEVVITITETETCKRCGDTRVVSENKEVTTLETPSDIVGEDIADDSDTTATSEPESEPDAPSTTNDAEFIDEAEDDATTETAESTESTDSTGSTPPAEPVEMPGTDETEPDSDEDDAVILDEETESDEEEADGRAPGEWPDEDDEDEEEDWTPGSGQELRPVEDEQPDVEPTSSAVTVPDGEFHCPECGFSTPVEASSLREGDFCPECHRGSLTHTPDEE